MTTRTNSRRSPRETPPPGKFGRSQSGVYFRIVLQRDRNARGEKLYRLYYLADGVRGNHLWTKAELEAAGIRWLKRRPTLRT